MRAARTSRGLTGRRDRSRRACRCRSRAGPRTERSVARPAIRRRRSTPVSRSSTPPTPTTCTPTRSATTRSSIADALRSWGGDPTVGARRDQGRAPAPRRRLVDPQRRPGLPQAGGQGARPSGSASTRSGSTSSTGPTRRCPYAESVGALAELLDEGVIVRAGISNATVAQIDEANEVLGGRLVSVQNQFSPAFRSSRDELEHCARLGIAFLPWSPLGGISKAAGARRPPRRRSPRSRRRTA